MEETNVRSGEASTVGAPPRPEAEKVVQHAHLGEVSGTIRSATSSRESVEPLTANTVGVSPVRTIVRATCKLKIDIRAMSESERHQFYKAADYNLRMLSRAMNTLTRKLWLTDGEALDALGDVKITAKVWPVQISMTDAYHVVRGAAPDLPSRTAATASRAAYKKWQQTRWDALVRCILRPPHYTCPPIPIHNQDLRVEPAAVSMQMRAGTGNRMRLPLVVRDAWQERLLANLADGTWKVGEAKLERDPQRPGRWYLRIAYKKPVDELPPTDRTAAINRGIRNFLAVVTHNGEDLLYSGADIVEHLRRMKARRQQIQRCYPVSGRKGRGRGKALAVLRKLEAATERWRATRSQAIAREVARWLSKRDVTVVYIEDFTGIRHDAHARLGVEVGQLVQEWPYYNLQQRLISCCEEAGLHVVQVAAEYISQSCPECGHTSEENRDLRRWKLRCTKCGYNRHLDVAAAHNVRLRGEKSGGKVLVGSESLAKSDTDESKAGTARKSRRKGARGRGSRGAR